MTIRAFTHGRSVSIPDNILQMVLHMPTIDMRKEAFTSEIPRSTARPGRKTYGMYNPWIMDTSMFERKK